MLMAIGLVMTTARLGPFNIVSVGCQVSARLLGSAVARHPRQSWSETTGATTTVNGRHTFCISPM
jgi:hypothetical protein